LGRIGVLALLESACDNALVNAALQQSQERRHDRFRGYLVRRACRLVVAIIVGLAVWTALVGGVLPPIEVWRCQADYDARGRAAAELYAERHEWISLPSYSCPLSFSALGDFDPPPSPLERARQ
jgi:peptidoglycan/LPS O-acetylase OafA/YrhL